MLKKLNIILNIMVFNSNFLTLSTPCLVYIDLCNIYYYYGIVTYYNNKYYYGVTVTELPEMIIH